jgi:PhoH-like ATPase
LRFDLLTNQYLLIKAEDGKIIDKYKFDGNKTVKIKYKTIKSQILDEVKPRSGNAKQELYFDLLQAEIPLKAVLGPAGSGKSYLSTAWALQELQKGNFQKLVVIKNNVLADSVPDIGAIPGSEFDKLRQHCGFISDITSDFMFESMVQKNQLELIYLGTIRGRSLSNCIVLCSEAQNLTTKLVKMIVTRIGDKSTLIFDFDIDQIDKKSFEKDNGMMTMIESIKGNKLFGIVELETIERSEVAKLASLF